MDDHRTLCPRPIDYLSNTVSSQSLSNPNPLSIVSARWLKGEETTKKIISCIHPTVTSQQRRKDVTNYLQMIFRTCVGTEVFPFGSVPLKTYLPSGDIDITALCSQNGEEAVASSVFHLLKQEEQNEFAEFEVKDIRYIDAKVKLIKCMVQNLSVDISFNQLGGLSKLCFLEQVDHIIGQDHLFKRSIILIKSWCSYESRILGAFHGFLSSYALEILVLYIFQLFYPSLHGPLEVLYWFLDYYSKFDWEKYCIGLSGPICISYLPKVVVEKPENNGAKLFLKEQYLKNCVDLFCAPQKVPETMPFLLKHLNIIDPLKENNNLGRSISAANFDRICNAFSSGAQELGHILSCSDDIPVDIDKFFHNTIDRHGSGYRPDVQDHVFSRSLVESRPATSDTEVGTSLRSVEKTLDLSGDYELHFSNLMYCQSRYNVSSTGPLLHGRLSPTSQRWHDKSHFNVDLTSSAALGGNEIQRPRGLGTFFPLTRPTADRVIPHEKPEHLPFAALSLKVSRLLNETSQGSKFSISPIVQKPVVETSDHTPHRSTLRMQKPKESSLNPDSGNLILHENLGCGSTGHLPSAGSLLKVNRLLHDTSLVSALNLSPTIQKPILDSSLNPDSGDLTPPENLGCGSSGLSASSLEVSRPLSDGSLGSAMSLAQMMQKPILESNIDPQRSSVKVQSLHLDNENEFPPLSVPDRKRPRRAWAIIKDSK